MARIRWPEIVLRGSAADGDDDEVVTAHVCAGLTEGNLAEYEAFWKPVLVPGRLPGWHWDWRERQETCARCAQEWAGAWPVGEREVFPPRCLTLEIGGHLEGLLMLNYEHRSSLVAEARIVYIERLIAAPWNKRGAQPRRYRGVGAVLLRHAICESLDLGWGGRVGLSSLDEDSSSFYRNQGMTFVRRDAETDLDIYEFTQEAAGLALNA